VCVEARTMSGRSWLLLATFTSGCAWITEDDLAARKDPDHTFTLTGGRQILPEVA